MDGTSNLMGNTLSALDEMMKSGGSKHMCYLVLFIFAVFMMIWWMVR
jgi:hypothetical protein